MAHSTVNHRELPIYMLLAFSYVCKFILYRFLTNLDSGLAPLELAGAYITNGAAAFAVASLLFLTWRRYPSILLMLLVDIWLFANTLYHAANLVFIDWQTITLLSELRGFEDSILVFLSWRHFMFFLLTAIMSLVLLLTRSRRPVAWRSFLHTAAFALVALLIGWSVLFFATDKTEDFAFRGEEDHAVIYHSPVGHLLAVAKNAFIEGALNLRAAMPLSAEEQQLLETIYTAPAAPQPPTGHCVYILVESLESWALAATDVHGNLVCPHLNHYIRSHNVLFSDGIISQQRYGRSGDGQLITQTGLLPLQHGVACMLYGDNVYPNLAHFYPYSVLINPYSGVWNQEVTTYSYGFHRLRQQMMMQRGNDSIVFVQTREELEQAVSPTYVLAITLNTHAPFYDVPPTLTLSPDLYTPVENRYLQCVHALDRHVGTFLAWADTAAIMHDATIVITADHNHFPPQNGKGLCPLIISSPYITSSTYIPSAYQMDIFSTVLPLINQENYAWKGFGINLLHNNSSRRISPAAASALSDKLIRANGFAPGVGESR